MDLPNYIARKDKKKENYIEITIILKEDSIVGKF
jgi:hypothetical protein